MKIDLIINSQTVPARGRELDLALWKKFRKHDCHLHYTRHAGHALDIARDAVERGCEILVAVGGDGTIHEVANGSRDTKVPIGIIPTGTANDLARQLGIPFDLQEACDIILEGRPRRLDAINVNGTYFLTTCGIGFPARSVAIAQTLFSPVIVPRPFKRRVGQRIYMWGVVLALFMRMPRHTIRIRCDGDTTMYRSMSFIIGIQPILGGRFTVLPQADLNAGRLSCYLIESDSRTLLWKHIQATRGGSQADLPGARLFAAKHVIIETTPAAAMFGDGEIAGISDRFDLRIIPSAVPVIIPGRRRDAS